MLRTQFILLFSVFLHPNRNWFMCLEQLMHVAHFSVIYFTIWQKWTLYNCNPLCQSYSKVTLNSLKWLQHWCWYIESNALVFWRSFWNTNTAEWHAEWYQHGTITYPLPRGCLVYHSVILREGRTLFFYGFKMFNTFFFFFIPAAL